MTACLPEPYEERVRRFAELGGGRGPIAKFLSARGTQTSVVDLNPQMLSEAMALGCGPTWPRYPSLIDPWTGRPQ